MRTHSKNAGKLVAAIFLVGGALSATGATCNIKPNKAGLWHVASSYEEGTLPQSGDTIQVAAGVHATANDDDCGFLRTAGVAQLKIRGASDAEKSSLTVTVTGEEAVFPCRIWAGDTDRAPECQYTHGLVKEGPGRLRLAPSGGNAYDLDCNYVVNNGILQFPAEPKYKLRHYKRLTVNSPGVAWMSTAESGESQNMYFNEGLCGNGVFSNTVNVAHTVRIGSSGKYGDVPKFTGRIAGKVKLHSIEGMTIMAGTCDSTQSVTLYNSAKMYMAVIGGGTGENVVSGSTGSGNFVVQGLQDGDIANATIGYIGDGQTAYANVTGNKTVDSFTINGGPNGGLDFAGNITFTDQTNSTVSLVLDGTNAAECVLSGKVAGAATGGRTIRVVKRGSGTWRIPENGESAVNGVVAVEEGTLKADKLAQAGKNSSLGYSTASLPLPYSVLLGAESTRGTLEYSGVSDTLISTRPIALAGEGTLKSDGAALSWYGVTAADAGAKTLVLGGAAVGSSIYDVTNGPGTVSVVKEGSGSWKLGGTLGFTGGIEVREGSLSISSATNFYKWYRLLVKENFEGTRQVDIGRIGLFNKDGIMQCANLSTNHAAYGDVALLHPGETIFYTHRANISLDDFLSAGANLEKCFKPISDTSTFWRFNCNNFGDTKFTPTLNNRNTWVGCVLRPPANADPVTSYDLGARWSLAHSSVKYMPQSWILEGSVDGEKWRELSSVVSNREWRAYGYWVKGDTRFFYNSSTKQDDPYAPNVGGWQIDPGIAPEATLDAGIDNLSVSANATVSSDKTVTTRRITIDAAGMGSATGFALAEGGVIDIVNAPGTTGFTVDVDFTGIALPASYSTLVNGKATKGAVVISPDGRKISVTAVGLAVIIR